MFAPKTILVPTDFSKYSDKALEQAFDIAKQHKAKIYLLHVIDVIQQCAIDYCLDIATVNALEEKSVKSAKDMMQDQIKRVIKSGDVKIIPDVKKGSVYQEILNEQKKKKIGLIVIASHGKTGMLASLMGSVAEKVTKAAKCPVFLLRS